MKNGNFATSHSFMTLLKYYIEALEVKFIIVLLRAGQFSYNYADMGFLCRYTFVQTRARTGKDCDRQWARLI